MQHPPETLQLALPDDTASSESGIENEDNKYAALFYETNMFLPGKLESFKIGSMFPFLGIGRFLPVLDFLSDGASAGKRCLFVNKIKYPLYKM